MLEKTSILKANISIGFSNGSVTQYETYYKSYQYVFRTIGDMSNYPLYCN